MSDPITTTINAHSVYVAAPPASTTINANIVHLTWGVGADSSPPAVQSLVVAGGLDIEGGLTASGGTSLTDDVTITGYVEVRGDERVLGSSFVGTNLQVNGGCAFFGAPVNDTRPRVQGSWSDGSAGASLCAALASLGLVWDDS